jgi:beta-carotene ketolase (CrtW type)
VVQSDQAFPNFIKLDSGVIKKEIGVISGLIIAFIIIGLWASNLLFLLFLDISKIQLVWIVLAIFLQTFLYTGLFITAHDAMHGVVFPNNPKINNLIGSLAASVYGLFSYRELLKKHWLHHHHPASELDPDFHDSKHKNFCAWYFHFMKGYWSWTRLIGLMLIFNFLHYAFHVPQINLTLFWAIPPILSSVQLFYFGTFLTHREPEGGYSNRHSAETTPLPVFWSFITCYHFGYHKEHHEYPHVPWWKLPEVYRRCTENS